MKCNCSSGGGGIDEKSAFSVTSSSKYEVDYLGEKTKGDLNVKMEHLQAFGNFFIIPLSKIPVHSFNFPTCETATVLACNV